MLLLAPFGRSAAISTAKIKITYQVNPYKKKLKYARNVGASSLTQPGIENYTNELGNLTFISP